MDVRFRSRLKWAPDDPVRRRLVFVCCSRRKTNTDQPIAALELYQGGCVPQLRARIGARPELRARVRILSAEHGIVHADTKLLPYDRPLTEERAAELQPRTSQVLRSELERNGVPREVLVVAEPLYLALIQDLIDMPDHPTVELFSNPVADWPGASSVLDKWGWP